MKPLVVQCKGCNSVCLVAPIPIDYIAYLLGDNKSFAQGMNFLHGEEIVFSCQDRGRLMTVRFTGDR